MNFFGIGVMELAVIFLIAFLVMGPAKTIEMARSAGKLIGDLRRTVNDMTSAADLSGLGRLDQFPPSGSTNPGPTPPGRPPDPPPTGAVPTTGPIQGQAEDSAVEGIPGDSGAGNSSAQDINPGDGNPGDGNPGDGNEQRP